jgi:hypothetical protein
LLPDSSDLPPRGAVSDFIGKWAGSFSLPELPGDDPRLAYLVGKHVK